jgi:hypothetical protein
MNIALETVCYVINRARELTADLNTLDTGESGKHAADDVVREDLPEDDEAAPAYQESPEYDDLREYIDNLNEDEQSELVAIAWIGRGTYTSADWDEAVELAADEHTSHTATYLLGQPLLADELEEGLNELGLPCEDVD